MDQIVTATVESTATPSAPSTIGDAAASLAAADRSLSDSPAVSDGEPAATAPEAAPATSETVSTVTPETTPETKPAGPIPFEVHKTALENARTKAAQETEAKLKAEMGWAQGIPAADGPRMAQMYQHFVTDPAGFVFDTLARLNQHPQYAQAVRSQAARMLGTRSPQADPEPGPDLEDPTTGTKLYSAEQSAKREAWLRKQLLAEVQKELQPLKQEREQQQLIAQQRQIHQRATEQLTELRKIPQFAEHEPAIKALMLADPALSVDAAFNKVLLESVVPAIKSSAQSEAVAELQQKAVASMRNPAAAQTLVPPNVLGNARAALEHADALLRGA